MLCDTEDLEELAETCLATAKAIKSHLAANGQPQMSFDQNGPPSFPDVPPNVQFARHILREAAQRLIDLAAGPDEIIGLSPYHNAMDLNAFRYVHRYNIAYAVPVNSAISYAELAIKCGVDAGQLKQILRQLMLLKVFRESTPGQVEHTAASKHLSKSGTHALNKFISTETFAAIANYLDAIEKWGHGSQESNETGLQLAYNTDKPIFNYYEENKVVGERFSELMVCISTVPLLSSVWVADGYDWAALGPATVVDIAGGRGSSSVPIAQVNLEATIIVQNLPVTIHRCQDPARSVLPIELRARFQFMVHNFYDPQPVRADVFFLQMIMHDYSDKYCIKILRNLVAALNTGGRIIIMDQVLPAPGGALYPLERFLRTQDMHRSVLMNAKERDREQWDELLKATDPRLVIKSITQPPGSLMALIEVVISKRAIHHP